MEHVYTPLPADMLLAVYMPPPRNTNPLPSRCSDSLKPRDGALFATLATFDIFSFFTNAAGTKTVPLLEHGYSPWRGQRFSQQRDFRRDSSKQTFSSSFAHKELLSVLETGANNESIDTKTAQWRLLWRELQLCAFLTETIYKENHYLHWAYEAQSVFLCRFTAHVYGNTVEEHPHVFVEKALHLEKWFQVDYMPNC